MRRNLPALVVLLTVMSCLTSDRPHAQSLIACTLALPSNNFFPDYGYPCSVAGSAMSCTYQWPAGYDLLRLSSASAQPSSCAWTAVTDVPWLVIPGDTSGVVSAGGPWVEFQLRPNTTGVQRTGTITVNNVTFTVTQPGVNAAADHYEVAFDGRADLLITSATGDIATLATNYGYSAQPSYLFQTLYPPTVPMTNVGTDWQLVGAGDLDGDGWPDLVWQHTNGSLAVWFMYQGAYVRATSPLLLNGSPASVGTSGWRVRAVGDVDGDGHADLIWQNSVDGGLAVWFMNAQVVARTEVMTLNGSPVTMPDPNWVIAGAGDLNRDFKADLVWQNQATGGLGAWTMDGSAVQMMRNLTPNNIPLDFKIGAVGDVDYDGVADIVWIKQSTRELFVWSMNGFVASNYQGPLLVPNSTMTLALQPGWTLAGPR